jgi:homoserine O-acetyltransferase/O-succinyltransferase
LQEKEFHFDSPFELESGLQLPDLRISYNTYGKLNEQRDNVVWVCHALTASAAVHDWWAGLFGVGNVLDPEKNFIICANNLGSPYGTTSPDHINPTTGERYGMSFPAFTLKDTANSIIGLMEALDIQHIDTLIGGSCGGNIALEMAVQLGSKIKRLVLICSSARETPWTIAIHQSQRIALESDPDFKNNKSKAGINGLKAARAFALPFYRTAQSLNIRQKEEDSNKVSDYRSASYISYQGEKFIKRFDAHCYYKLLNALDTHNLERGHNSISDPFNKIKSQTLVIGIDTDLFIPIEEQKFLVEHIPDAQYLEIKSMYGHDAFLIETKQIQNFLLKKEMI